MKRNIAILSGNCMEFAEFVLGSVYAGCVPVLLDPKWHPGEIDKVIRQCEPGLIANEGRFAADLAERYNEPLPDEWNLGEADDVARFIRVLLNHKDPELTGKVFSVNGKQITHWQKPQPLAPVTSGLEDYLK